MRPVSREQLERVARMYKSNEDASRALGISLGGFSRACRRHGIMTPFTRRYGQRGGQAQAEGPAR
jgi:hypothetical protein